MIKASINILSSTSTMNSIPMYFEVDSIRDLTNFIRNNSIDILSWPFKSYGQVNNTKIGIYIREDIEDYYYEWSFIIKCSNIREFKPYIKMGYDEFDAVYKEHKRNNIISEILDNG
jgi:hypothetical protein